MEKIKEYLKKIKIQSIALSVALIVIGLLFIIFPASSARIICYVAGAVLLLWGIFKVTVYFAAGMRETTYELAAGVALIAVAVLLFVKPVFIAEMLTLVFGIILIVDGVVKLQQSLNLARRKVGGWWWVLIIAVATLIFGLIITFNPFSSRNAIMIFSGVCLMVDGIIDIITTSYYNSKVEKQLKRNDVIDV